MENLTRYEFSGTGIFHILPLLEDCDMEQRDAEELELIERIFEEALPHPEIEWNKDLQCWFTEQGKERFKEELETFLFLTEKYLESSGLGTLEVKKDNMNEQTTVYRDCWQVVIAVKNRGGQYDTKEYNHQVVLGP